MDDYISRQPDIAGDCVSRQYLLDEYDRQHQGPPGGARKIIEEAPAAQPEIVRCRNCCFFTTAGSCCMPEGLVTVNPDDFCSYGERKEA